MELTKTDKTKLAGLILDICKMEPLSIDIEDGLIKFTTLAGEALTLEAAGHIAVVTGQSDATDQVSDWGVGGTEGANYARGWVRINHPEKPLFDGQTLRMALANARR